MSRKAEKSYYPILKLVRGRLVLWDGPRNSEGEAKSILKIRKKQHPAGKFFIYQEDAFYQEAVMGSPKMSKSVSG